MKRKRDPAYYRDYRRRKKLQKLAAENHAPIEFHGEPPPLETVFTWIEANLRVPTGPLAGEKFKLPAWQREWLAGAMQPNIREAGLSISRKNGKSGLIAAVIAAYLVGPLNRPSWRAIVGSLTGNLAKELRDALTQTLNASGFSRDYELRKSPPPGVVVGKRGAKIDFLAADRASGHALGADLAIFDEAGLLPEAKRDLWNAIYSSISGRDGAMWAISIQGDGPMFAEMAEREGSPNVYFRKWEAPLDADIFSKEAWIAGNPAIVDGIKSMAYMADAAERAKGSPGNENHFRAYDLNQPVDPARETIVSVREYAECIDPHAGAIEGELTVGIDLGGSVSMTAAAAIDGGGRILVRGAFGEEPPLSERARRDRMGTLYARMVKEGTLRLYPGTVTPVIPFLRDFFAEVSQLGRIAVVGADRFRKAECQMALHAAGVAFVPVQWRGQGASATADGSHDVRAFQRLVRQHRLKTPACTMLEAAIASSVLRFDTSGNPALDKAANNARIDALSAAVIAAGLQELRTPAPLLKVSVV